MPNTIGGNMRKLFVGLACLLTIAACAGPPSRLVYSSGFSFANYDYIVIAKPEGNNTITSLYGMDVEFSNLMSRYNMKVIGDKEYAVLPQDVQKRTLTARMSITASAKNTLMSVSFDDAVSGRTVSSISAYTKGNLMNLKSRTKAFEVVSESILRALEQDKGLKITDEKITEKKVTEGESTKPAFKHN